MQEAKARGFGSESRFPPRRDMEIYDPCAPDPGLELPSIRLQKNYWMELRGFIFIPCANRNSDALSDTLKAVEEQFGPYMHRMKWINFGGGHHITREDYDRELLKKCIRHVQDTYGVQVYLEPGEAVA